MNTKHSQLSELRISINKVKRSLDYADLEIVRQCYWHKVNTIVRHFFSATKAIS